MEAVSDASMMEELSVRFQALAAVVPLRSVKTSEDYDKAVAMLNDLLDRGAASDGHQLADLVDTLGVLIGEYEVKHYPPAAVSALESLRFLMQQHGLTQSDLPEVGSQGVVSEILMGKRELNVRQIRALAARFSVPPSLFI